jgi:hypothetical protein
MSLRERLEAKSRVTTTYDLAVADPTGAESKVAAAGAALTLALHEHDEDSAEAGSARAALDAARAELDACFETITFQALPPDDFEALVAAHPPKTRPDRDEWEKTFEPALIALCAQGDLGEQWWLDYLASGKVSSGERDALFRNALAANVRARSTSLPKGSSATRG